MILNIFDDIWNKLTDISNNCYDFIMEHFDDPFFWIIIFVVLITICYVTISSIANK